MNAVRDDVDKLIEKELTAANERYPLFASPHEGYAVIKEEYEELEDELKPMLWELTNIWKNVRDNEHSCTWLIDAMYDHAVNAAIEAIQVAAMCEKWRMSAEKWKE